jgi:hypothetical protein
MVRYKQSKGITEKMLNAIITNNTMNEIGKRMNSGNTKTYKPMISPNSVSPLNPYLINKWLFNGIDGKKRS